MEHMPTHRKARRQSNRSGCLLCPICSHLEILVEHHIAGRNIKDFDGEWNKANICSNCHRKVHEGLIVIEGWFQTTDGRQLIFRHVDESPIINEGVSPYIIP